MDSPKRAKKVRFFRNGDKFFSGFLFAIPFERYKTFDALLHDLTDSPVCDKNVLPQGVRFVFCMNGQKIRSLEEFADGGSYVCASFDQFKKVDYAASSSKNFNSVVKTSNNGTIPALPPLKKKSDANGKDIIQKEDFKPQVVVVFAGGARPRKGTRILLSIRTAKTFDYVMTEISKSIKLSTGAVRKLYDLNGRQVHGLSDLLGEQSVFVAYGNERMNHNDLTLDENDHKFINSYSNRGSGAQSARGPSRSGLQKGTHGNAPTNSLPNSPDPRRRSVQKPKASAVRRKSTDHQINNNNGDLEHHESNGNGHESPAAESMSPTEELHHMSNGKREVMGAGGESDHLVDPAAD